MSRDRGSSAPGGVDPASGSACRRNEAPSVSIVTALSAEVRAPAGIEAFTRKTRPTRCSRRLVVCPDRELDVHRLPTPRGYHCNALRRGSEPNRGPIARPTPRPARRRVVLVLVPALAEPNTSCLPVARRTARWRRGRRRRGHRAPRSRPRREATAGSSSIRRKNPGAMSDSSTTCRRSRPRYARWRHLPGSSCDRRASA